MITMAIVIRISWLTASMIAERASGIRTPHSSWRSVAPKVVAASTVTSGTCLIPRAVTRTPAANA